MRLRRAAGRLDRLLSNVVELQSRAGFADRDARLALEPAHEAVAIVDLLG